MKVTLKSRLELPLQLQSKMHFPCGKSLFSPPAPREICTHPCHFYDRHLATSPMHLCAFLLALPKWPRPDCSLPRPSLRLTFAASNWRDEGITPLPPRQDEAGFLVLAIKAADPPNSVFLCQCNPPLSSEPSLQPSYPEIPPNLLLLLPISPPPLNQQPWGRSQRNHFLF